MNLLKIDNAIMCTKEVIPQAIFQGSPQIHALWELPIIVMKIIKENMDQEPNFGNIYQTIG
jgi:hypothetical protein